jgi:hypothetical protein
MLINTCILVRPTFLLELVNKPEDKYRMFIVNSYHIGNNNAASNTILLKVR